MSLLTHSEALTVSDAFLCCLYGDELFGKWRELKSEMRFVTERDYISWFLEVANCYRNKENLAQMTNDTESAKGGVVLQVQADDNHNVSQPLLDERHQKLQLKSSAQEPSDITLCQREQLDNAELNQPSTSHDYYQQRDGAVQKDIMDLGEEMLEGISLKHLLKGSVIKQEVSEVEDSEQCEVSSKLSQEPGDTVTMMNELSKEKHIKCEDALLKGVCFKLETPSGLIDENNDKNVDVGNSMSKNANEFVVQQQMSPSSPDGSVDQEYMGGADCPSTTMPVKHKRTHTSENLYSCDKCPYATAWADELMRHKRIHAGEKPYRCDKCPFATEQAGQLAIYKCKHSIEKLYSCDKCPYATARASDLVRHKRTHTGEKPYRCDKCPFNAQAMLVQIRGFYQLWLIRSCNIHVIICIPAQAHGEKQRKAISEINNLYAETMLS